MSQPYTQASPTPTPVVTPQTTTVDPTVAAGEAASYTGPPVPPQLLREGTPEQISAWKAWQVGQQVTGVTPGGTTDREQALKDAFALILGSQAATVDPTVAAGESAYMDIWGVTPPKGYIQKLVDAGLNKFQIQLHELSQPGANRTQYWRDNEAAIASRIASLMGRRA